MYLFEASGMGSEGLGFKEGSHRIEIFEVVVWESVYSRVCCQFLHVAHAIGTVHNVSNALPLVERYQISFLL